ncbi:uncharacterized protein G2W53_037351 [Senna tora]|uniref:Uncharacterized protein n=1 Tax=Senna tora TaxID=362788 RepID=A0A834SU80_9FABA|nr:uncharacterized protein G2W53_037351 [Senna tora]
MALKCEGMLMKITNMVQKQYRQKLDSFITNIKNKIPTMIAL